MWGGGEEKILFKKKKEKQQQLHQQRCTLTVHGPISFLFHLMNHLSKDVNFKITVEAVMKKFCTCKCLLTL